MKPTRHPSEIPRFFEADAPRTIYEVMRAPLEVDALGLEYDPLSPTPLDAWRLRIKNGPLYDDQAQLFMDDQLHRTAMPPPQNLSEMNEWIEAEGQGRVSSATAKLATRELIAQHQLKQLRNDQALESLSANRTEIDVDTAEMIMQVRAGIASLETYFRFLAMFPEVGGVETMKASVPFDPRRAERARAEAIRRLAETNSEGVIVGIQREASYYRRIEIEDSRIVVLKIHLANVAIDSLPHEQMITREAGVILNPKKDDLSLAYRIATRADGSKVHVAPIAMTWYGRLAPRQ
ncbi:MAG: hypothetical protein ABIP74_03860 [Candidatus Saccharimonas sp.]